MNAELRRTPDAEVWAQWEGQIVNGLFPLRRLLGCSSHSAVFLTEFKAKNLADVAIKLVRADAPQGKALLAQWEAAAALVHPHLVRLFKGGRLQFDGQEYAFVAMEHADQTLAGILRHRPLSPEEVRELLVPTLDALTFLHRRNLVHSQLKPSNFLAVGDELKLASDTLGPAGFRANAFYEASPYDDPERNEHGATTAGDIWSLGTTLFEALTQRTPADQRYEMDLPASVPAALVDTVRRCLSPAPANRPLVIDLRAEYKPTASAPEPLPARPAPNGSREAAPPLQTPAVSTATTAASTPTAPPATQAPSVSREVAPSSPALAVPRAAAPTAPVSLTVQATFVARERKPAPPTPGASIAAPPATPAPQASSGSREAASPIATIVSREVATPPAAPSVSREAEPLSPAPNVVPPTTPPPIPAPIVSRDATQPAPAPIVSLDPALELSAPARRLPLPAIAAGVLIVVIVWSGLRLMMSSPEADSEPTVVPAPAPTKPAPSPVANPATPAPRPVSHEPTQPSLPPEASTSPGVLHEVMPDVSRDVQDKIQGRIYVTVRVLVDPAGNVFAALMEDPGTSKYFARLADNASREWQFVPTEDQTDRVWLLNFKFTRDEVSVHASEQ